MGKVKKLSEEERDSIHLELTAEALKLYPKTKSLVATSHPMSCNPITKTKSNYLTVCVRSEHNDRTWILIIDSLDRICLAVTCIITEENWGIEQPAVTNPHIQELMEKIYVKTGEEYNKRYKVFPRNEPGLKRKILSFFKGEQNG